MKTLILLLTLIPSLAFAQAYESTFSITNYNEYAKLVDKFRYQASSCLFNTKERSDYLHICRKTVKSLDIIDQAMKNDRGSFTLELYDQFKEGLDNLNKAAGLAREYQADRRVSN